MKSKKTVLLWALLCPLFAASPAKCEPAPAEPGAARTNSAPGAFAGTKEVEQIMKTYRGVGMLDNGAKALTPQESLAKFTMRQGLTVDLIASEPAIVQPLNITFDSRGRPWIMQYIQFQFPAGLKIVSYDEYLRAVFDKVPEPPPKGAKGADKVTVLEDDGDGTYARHKDVITGLNIATAAIKGDGGIWVMNPPYLLFYPVADDGDVPSGDPQVCLSGFGIQDTHSVASNIQFGPDGWIYGANGSTTEGLISSRVTKNVRVQGQHIWRYNPKTAVFEVYAEGGGNTFSCEIDAQGRVFSGTNGGERGMHYEEGMSGTKSFGKHGMPDNPYAFGFFGHMETHGELRRFNQAFCIYDGALMPELEGDIIAGNALQNRVVASRRVPDTSTFKAVDVPVLMTSADPWFRPVDAAVGPDGGIWLADWYDSRLSYVRPVDDWSKTDGRIYRIRPAGVSMARPAFNLHTADVNVLLGLLNDPNKWFRKQSALELSWRNETSALPELAKMAADGGNPHAFDALCALQMLGGLTDERAVQLLEHPDPYVRRWVVRCVGDTDEASPKVAAALEALAKRENHPEVRTQLLASAKRLPGPVALPIVATMMTRAADLADKRIPLMLWWALESKAESDRAGVLALFSDGSAWESPLARTYGVHNLAERWAMAGGNENYDACATLLSLAPNASGRSLVVTGIADAFEGGKVPNLPPALASALDSYLKSALDVDLALAAKTGNREAVVKALAIAGDEKALSMKRAAMVQALAEAGEAQVVPVMLKIFTRPGNLRLKEAILPSAQKFDDERLPRAVLNNYLGGFTGNTGTKEAADRMLVSRQEWTKLFLAQIEKRTADRVGLLVAETKKIEPDVLRQMQLYHDPEIDRVIARRWPASIVKLSSTEKRAQMARMKGLLTSLGDPAKGRLLFTQTCSACHTLFGEGGHIGPELTSYQRDNLDFWLTAILDPSLEIREGFSLYSAKLKNGQTMVGMLVKQDGGGVVLKNLAGELQSAQASQIESLDASPVSLMPEGLLSGMDDAKLRDLFAYLMKP